jgi:hypothetical protein
VPVHFRHDRPVGLGTQLRRLEFSLFLDVRNIPATERLVDDTLFFVAVQGGKIGFVDISLPGCVSSLHLGLTDRFLEFSMIPGEIFIRPIGFSKLLPFSIEPP